MHCANSLQRREAEYPVHERTAHVQHEAEIQALRAQAEAAQATLQVEAARSTGRMRSRQAKAGSQPGRYLALARGC